MSIVVWFVSVVHDFYKFCYQKVYWLKFQMLVDVTLQHHCFAESRFCVQLL